MVNGFDFSQAVRVAQDQQKQSAQEWEQQTAQQQAQFEAARAAQDEDFNKSVKKVGWLAVGGVVLGIGSLVLLYFLIRGLIRAAKKK